MKDVTETVLNVLEDIGCKNTLSSDKLEDLGLDSLDIAGIIGICEHKLNLEIEEYDSFVYVYDIISFLKEKMRE